MRIRREGVVSLTEQGSFENRRINHRVSVGMPWRLASVWRVLARTLMLACAIVVLSNAEIRTHQPVLRAAPSAAGESTRDPRWTQYTRDRDLLASNDTRTVWVDDEALWFGGENGFSYFNGEWSSYSHILGLHASDALTRTSHIPLGVVKAFAKDAVRETLWAGSSGGLLLEWNGTQWSFVLDVKSAIHALELVDGEVWIGTNDGLYRFDSIDDDVMLVDAVGRLPVYSLAQDDENLWVGTSEGLWRFRQNRWTQIGAGVDNLQLGVYSMAISPEGHLVVGTEYGIGWQPGNDGRWEWYETEDEEGIHAGVWSLAFDHNGVLWAGSDGAGAFSLRLGADAYENYGYTGDLNLTTRFVRAVAVDRDNSIWFATPAGVFRFQAYRWINYAHGATDDVTNYINDLMVAGDGALWAVTGGAGIRRLDPVRQEEIIFTADDGASNAALALAEDGAGAIWVGGSDGLYRYAEGVWDQPIATQRLPSPEVTSLVVDGKQLWIGTGAGLVHYTLDSSELRTVQSLAGTSVEALALDNLGRIWAGTYGRGIFVRELDGRWRQFLHNSHDADSLPGNDVYSHSLAADAQIVGGMWAIVNGKELVRWDGVRWQRLTRAWPLPSSYLWTLYSDAESDSSDGSVWVGSEAGVTRYDGKTWHTFGATDGLQSAVVFAVARGQEGGYWFGGATGLTYFLPDKTPPWATLGPLAGDPPLNEEGLPVIAVNEDVMVHYDAGDLQTAPRRLRVLQRVAGPKASTPWVNAEDNYVRQHFNEPGIYTIELLARDESFNYSDVALLRVEVVEPPAMITLPGLGPVEISVFRTLAALGALVVLGSSYMAYVILSNRRRSQEALERGFNPYISGEPVRRDDMFFGRRALLQRIIDTLHSNSIMIHGERRIGKTSLLLNLMTALREVNDPEYWFVPVYIDLEGTPQESFFQLLMEEILVHVESLKNSSVEITPFLTKLRYYINQDDSYGDRDFNRDLNRITEILESYGDSHDPGKQLRLILLIDEMDVMGSYDRIIQQQLRRIFMREFAATLGAVVAGIQISKEWDRVESPWFNLFNDIELTPFTREQAIELLIEPVRGYYQYDLAAIEFILDHANGRPYKIQQYGLEAVNHMLAVRRRRITLADVEAAHRRLQAAERAGKPSGQRRLVKRTLLNRIQDVVNLSSSKTEPGGGKAESDTPKREGP